MWLTVRASTAFSDPSHIIFFCYSLSTIASYISTSPLYCVDVQPEADCVFATASDEGYIHLYDTRASDYRKQGDHFNNY